MIQTTGFKKNKLSTKDFPLENDAKARIIISILEHDSTPFVIADEESKVVRLVKPKSPLLAVITPAEAKRLHDLLEDGYSNEEAAIALVTGPQEGFDSYL